MIPGQKKTAKNAAYVLGALCLFLGASKCNTEDSRTENANADSSNVALVAPEPFEDPVAMRKYAEDRRNRNSVSYLREAAKYTPEEYAKSVKAYQEYIDAFEELQAREEKTGRDIMGQKITGGENPLDETLSSAFFDSQEQIMYSIMAGDKKRVDSALNDESNYDQELGMLHTGSSFKDSVTGSHKHGNKIIFEFKY